jgi:integrase
VSIYKRPGQTVYTYDFRYRRQRFSGSTGCTSRREALRFEEAEKKRVAALRFDATKPLPFKAAAAQYWNEVGCRHANSVDMLRALDWLVGNVGAATMLSEISDAVVARLVAKRRGEGVWRKNRKGKLERVGELSGASVNRSVCEPLRAILRRARRVWKQDVQDIEWRVHFLKEPQERVREASGDEEARLLAAIRPDYAPPLRFAFLTGCRRQEIVGLAWKDVDFFNREFTVTGKGDRSRTLPMTEAVYRLLWELKDHHKEWVFTYLAKRPRPGARKAACQPITMEGFKTEWRRARKRAGVEDFRFHDARHTAATRLVRATGNLKMAQQLLGHTDIATTSRYAHVTKDDLRAGLEAVSRPTPQRGKARRAKQ